MRRPELSHLAGGIAFGFIAGFLVAWAWVAPTTITAPAPAPPPPQMSGVEAGDGAATGGAEEGGAPHLDVMARVRELKEHVEHSPDDAAALRELGEMYLQAAKGDQALAYLKRAYDLEPSDSRGQLFLAMALSANDQTAEALELMDRAAKDNPKSWEPLYMRAVLLLRDRNDPDGALEALDRMERINPDVPGLADLREEARRRKSGSPQPGA